MRHHHDTASFDAVLNSLHKRAQRLTSDREEAEDLAQEAAMKVWVKTRGTEIDNIEAYAMTALGNLARSHWRARRPVDAYSDEMAATPPDAFRRLACAELRAALLRLPEPQARLMELVAEGETSPAQLARLTGQPLGTVMSRLARARATLRRDMGMDRTAPSATLFEEEPGG